MLAKAKIWRKLAVVLGLFAVSLAAYAASRPPSLPTAPPARALNALPANWSTGAYSTCSSTTSGPCTSSLNPGNTGVTAAGYKSRDCDMSEFSGLNGANIGVDGTTLYDAWLFVTDPANFYDLKISFTDTAGHAQVKTFPVTASPPSFPANSAYVYYTKNYSHVAVLTPRGWTLTGGTGLVDRLRNNKNLFELSHTCPGGSTTTSHGSTNGLCLYPENPTVINAAAKQASGAYTVTGSLTENGCGVPNEQVHLSGTSFSASPTTTSGGAFTTTGIPGTAFPITISYGGADGWPAAGSSVTVAKP